MGLEGLSIGALAEVTRMSKSGVFAHFGSREELQISVVREYHAKFEEEVFYPAMREPRGLPRLRALFDRWVRRVSVEIDSGCIYISGAVEFDDRPGPVRDALVGMVQTWQDGARARDPHGRRGGPPAAPTPTRQQMLFEVHGLILALHHDARFLRHPGAIDAGPGGASTASLTALRRRRPRAPARQAPMPTRRTAARPISQPNLNLVQFPGAFDMPQYTPPLRDMQFVMHEVLNVVDELKPLPPHAEIDADTINAVLEEGGKFAAEVLVPAEPERRRRRLHARQDDPRGDARPRASRRRTRNTSPAAGRR